MTSVSALDIAGCTTCDSADPPTVPRLLVASDAVRTASPAGTAPLSARAASLGWSLVWLPAPSVPDAAARAWFETVADLLSELSGGRVDAVLLLDESEPPDRRALARMTLVGLVAPDRLLIADADTDADAIVAALAGW